MRILSFVEYGICETDSIPNGAENVIVDLVKIIRQFDKSHSHGTGTHSKVLFLQKSGICGEHFVQVSNQLAKTPSKFLILILDESSIHCLSSHFVLNALS